MRSACTREKPLACSHCSSCSAVVLAGSATGKVTTRRGSPAAAARAARSARLVSGLSWGTGCAVCRSNSCAARANSSLRWSLSSVIVPTVERLVRTGVVWAIAVAGGTPSTVSTAGRSRRARNWRGEAAAGTRVCPCAISTTRHRPAVSTIACTGQRGPAMRFARTCWERGAGWVLGCALGAALALPAQAQWKIGQTVGLTGAVAATSAEARQGALLHFEAINRQGGIQGQTIELVTLDDQFEVAKAVEHARTLIGQGVLALFLNRGTPHTQALMPLLVEARIPLVAPSTGAMVLHQPVHPWIFNVRAAYHREAERAMAHLTQIGVRRIALVQVDDSFGDDAVQGALKGLKAANLSPISHQRYDRAKPDFGAIAPALAKADPQAVVFIGSGTAVVEGMKALRAAGSRAQLVTLSNNASGGFVKQLGETARGVIVSQGL